MKELFRRLLNWRVRARWINIYDTLQADKLSPVDPGGVELVRYWLLAGIAILVVVLYIYRSFTRSRKSAKPVGLNTYEA